jgi:GT2 family glycosyltransferase
MNQQNLVTIVIPTVGGSSVFRDCLEALANDRRAGARIVVVADRDMPAVEIPRDLIDLLVRAPRNGGFATSCNLGLAEVETELSAIINDDAIVTADWLQTMITELGRNPQAAAIQGLNFQMHAAGKIDGCGITWNDRWQPVQIDHGLGRASITEIQEVFGASATAAVFRQSALIEVATGPDQIFDPNLHTYYDDVDLAGRLRSAGYASLVAPSARAQHAGGASSEAALPWRYRQLYGNRLLVLARLLGRQLWPRLPQILSADLRDFARAVERRDKVQFTGIMRGWQRAAGLLPKFAHAGKPLVSTAEIERLRNLLPRGTSAP